MIRIMTVINVLGYKVEYEIKEDGKIVIIINGNAVKVVDNMKQAVKFTIV